MKPAKLFPGAFVIFCGIFLFTKVISAQPKHIGHPAILEEYVCTPCGHDCDKIISYKPGVCPQCGMPLVKKSSITFKTIQPEDICSYIKNHPQVILLDVRTREEFEGRANPDYGTLQNAINIPVQELASRIAEIESLKEKEVIVYCSHSHRSPQASYILTQNGFINVTNMAGGMSTLKDNSCKK